MINGIFSTFSGKVAAERRLDVVANNIANAFTAGFKASRPIYNGSTLDADMDPGQVNQTYVNIPDVYVHFSDGPLVSTGNSLDVGIEGSGFFVVSTPKGNMYTRDGQFTLDVNKQLVTTDGDPVMGQNGGPITINGKAVNIGTDGTVSVDGAVVDKIKVVDFSDKSSLKNFGKNLFVNNSATNSETTADKATVKQGYYETSNVNTVTEMVEMVSAMRAYEAYTKADQSVDDSLGKLIDMGKP